MLWSAFIAFAAGAVMLVLSLFGYAHLRRTALEAEILPRIATRTRVRASSTKDVSDFAGGIEDQNVPGGWVGLPPAQCRVQHES
jgi:hypothetical protein